MGAMRADDEAEEGVLEALRLLGVDEAAAAEAIAADRVPLALVRKIAEVDRPYSFEDIVERTGVPAWVLRERYRSLGFPDAGHYGEGEIAEARLLGELLQVMSPDALVRVLRIDGQALTRIALAHLDLVYAEVVAPVREEGGDDVAVAVALVEAYQNLRPLAGDLLRHSYDRIISQLLSSELVAEATRSGGDELELTVGFADVVGYTSLSARIDPRGLEEVITAFETRCYTVAGTLESVQLVKFLGDAAMFVSTEPKALATALLALVARPGEESPLTGSPVRAGIAHGPVLLRGGDYYGPTVNLAARLTDRARAGRVLAAGDLGDQLEGLDVRWAPAMHLRGIGRHKPVAVRLPKSTRTD
jgi:adenylate cyclase